MPILLLDEATSSLDPGTEAAMRSIIHQEFTEKGHTIIAITHRLSGVTENVRAGQDMFVLLSKGKIERIDRVEDYISPISKRLSTSGPSSLEEEEEELGGDKRRRIST
jgi:ABC-type thiamine transport system ATPase subunit